VIEVLMQKTLFNHLVEGYTVKAKKNTPVGYFTGAIENRSWCPTGNILHGENEVFQRNRNDFPKVSFTLDVI
jgi:hypothetical protein